MSFTESRPALELHARCDTGTGCDPVQEGWSFARVAADERADVEHFVAARFMRAYGARLRRFFPVLMTLRQQGELVAACGLRHAASERLFLEAYLDHAVENMLSAAAREPVVRGGIVEVGNLAVARAGVARRLIAALTFHLNAAGATWSVFSAVAPLRNNFRRLGIPAIALAPADRNRLPHAERRDWGSYYDSAPYVTAVRVAAAHAALSGVPCTP